MAHAPSPPILTIALVGDHLRPHLAWPVIVAEDGGFGSWTVTVDARDGAVLRVVENWITD